MIDATLVLPLSEFEVIHRFTVGLERVENEKAELPLEQQESVTSATRRCPALV
ncbi:hypothetical protein SRB17_34490 [Streptomyces sp. RB17]|uniref:hypothetical protein n=1 Tax=Streptomyces sp. RB17 TaxID=2585197 RepID=UPI00130B4B9D|nr:hypothetical protein [Streptomyces sp. RB17]MQY35471.1 hypothetical protein [Streptomyces sp. RB17]